MSNVNKVILIGRLGADPELRYTKSGQGVCSLRLATTEMWGAGESRQERTEWHRVVVWGKQAELAGQYLQKGRLVYIEGRLQTRKWQASDGSDRYTTEIVARDIQFIDSRRDGAGGGRSATEEPPLPEDDFGHAAPSKGRAASTATQDPNQFPEDDDAPF